MSSDDVAIDEALVRRLLAAQFPQWADLPISPVPVSGMDNATYRLGEDMSVRLPRYPPPVWVHGDLAQGNLLAVDGHLSAVIDFGTLAVGDPACDLLPAWTFLPAEARGAFRAALDVDDATWARGRGWGLASSLPVLDDPYFDVPGRRDAALRHLDEIIADL